MQRVLAVGALLILCAVAGAALLLRDDSQPTQCTMEAKICPDGTAVGRTGPNCEFAECPGGVVNNGGGEVACTKEAKICPDGSAVGRTGPNCEFAECPNTETSKVVTVSVGEEVVYNGVTFSVLSVQDSRCPKNVVCIWAGEVKATIKATKNGTSNQIILLEKAQGELFGIQITVKSIYSYGRAEVQDPSRPVDQSAYRIELVLTQ